MDLNASHELTPKAMVDQLARVIGGELLLTLTEDTSYYDVRLIGNLQTGIFAVVNSRRSDTSIERVRVFGNILKADRGLISALEEDYESVREWPSLLHKLSTILAEGKPIVPWWDVSSSARFHLKKFNLQECRPDIYDIVFSRLHNHQPGPAFGFKGGVTSPEIPIPKPGELYISEVTHVFRKHNYHPVLYRVHLNEPYFMPFNLEIPGDILEKEVNEGRFSSLLDISVMYPVDQLEDGKMSPRAGLVLISTSDNLCSDAYPPIGSVSNILSFIDSPPIMPLSKALALYGANIGISATLTQKGLQFFQNGEPIPQEVACFQISREKASQIVAPYRGRHSIAIDNHTPVKISKGQIVLASRDDLFKAISALAGYNEKTDLTIPPLAPDVAEFEHSGDFLLANLASYGQSMSPRASREEIENAVNELINNSGSRVSFPFDCAGHLSDGTEGTLSLRDKNTQFPALINFHGGGFGEHHLRRVAAATGLPREIELIKFTIPIKSVSHERNIYLVNYSGLLRKGYVLTHFYNTLSIKGSEKFNPEEKAVSVSIKTCFDSFGLGEVEDNTYAYTRIEGDPAEFFFLEVELKFPESSGSNLSEEELQLAVGRLRSELIGLLNSESN